MPPHSMPREPSLLPPARRPAGRGWRRSASGALVGTYDLLDNLGRHSAEHIVPDLQHLEVGDLVPLGPGKDSGMRIKAFEPNQWMLWWDMKIQLTTWAWAMYPMPDGRTRLVTRVRARPAWRHPTTAVWLGLTEVADFPMMRKCLLGIKRRAEARVPETVSQAHEPKTSLSAIALKSS